MDHGDTSGWVNASYPAARGATEGVGSQVVEALGLIPSSGTMEELGRLVVEARLGPGLQGRSVIVATGKPGETIGEITIDVLVSGDDSVRGERLVVFGQRSQDGSGFSPYDVESTVLCWRGADADGLCV